MIPGDRAHVYVAANTHAGMSGKNNEDRFGVAAFYLPGEKPQPVVFAVVADGIGGHRAGEVAAELAVETISRGVAQSDGSQPVETLRQAIQQASAAIHAQAQTDNSKQGMGATCACALVIGERLFIASVGDSRLYLLREGVVQQISIDHTWIQEALDAGVINPDQAQNHPNAHVIRRYLGSPQPVDVDTRLRLSPGESDEAMFANQGMRLLPGDQVILCSDGLTDLVKPEEIQSAMRSHRGADQPKGIQALIHQANSRGGHDNITIVALEMPAGAFDASPTIPLQLSGETQKAAPRRLRLAACLSSVVLALLVVGALALGYWFYTTRPAAVGTITPTSTGPFITTQAATTAAGTGVPGTSVPATAPAASSTPRPFVTSSGPTLTPWPTSTR
jgi:protein phosphatase